MVKFFGEVSGILKNKYQSLGVKFRRCPLIPAMCVTRVEEAVSVAHALQRGGVTHLEILVRGNDEAQAQAVSALKAMLQSCAQMTLGAGTVNTAEKMRSVSAIGIHFMVSADSSREMLDLWKASATPIPYYPTGFTTTEIAHVLASGASGVKLFPKNQLVSPSLYLNTLNNIYGERCHLLLSSDETH